MPASVKDRNANAVENVVVVVDQELEHVRGLIAGGLMMDPAVNNSWIGKLLTARTNAKEMTARLRVSYASSIDCFAVVTGSASLIATLNSLPMTCQDSHKPVALL